MLRSLTAAQFHEWLSYAKLEPFDEERADYRAAQIVQMILAVNMTKDKKVPTLDELVLRFGDSRKVEAKPDWQKMKSIAMMLSGKE